MQQFIRGHDGRFGLLVVVGGLLVLIGSASLGSHVYDWINRTVAVQLTAPEMLIATAAIAAAIALATDLRWRRIPNWLTGTALLVGLVANVLVAGVQGGITALEGAGLGIAILLPFFVFRTMGAGDVKLLAAFGALLGPQAVLAVAVYGSLVGGLQSLVILARLGRLGLTFHQLLFMRVLPAQSGAKAPYAVALSAGLGLALLHPLGLSW